MNTILLDLQSLHNKHNTLMQLHNDFFKEFQELEKLVQKLAKQEQKKEKKKSGFARNQLVSTDLCDFLNISHDTLISRAETTIRLNTYIKQNNLQNPQAKREIIMDDKLCKLLGSDAEGQIITYFTIQKYMTKHFL